MQPFHALAAVAVLIPLAATTAGALRQDPPGDLSCVGSAAFDQSGASLGCNPLDCNDECDIRVRPTSNGFYTFCKCPSSSQPTPCCSVVLSWTTGNPAPTALAIGSCSLQNPDCDLGDVCLLVDVNEDGSLYEGWCL